ncbi:MAG: hypothetical protein Q8P53_02880 [Candidatus Shapirobacteria bacterium]|nr:hypothetical protein [Candidatus Shapirobacteria bacterium]
MTQLLAVNIGEIPLRTGQSLATTYPTVSILFSIIIKNALTIVGLIFLGLLIYGGLSYIIGAGSDDAKKAEQAKGIITNALIGFAIVFLSYFIIQIIQIITGIDILNPTL